MAVDELTAQLTRSRIFITAIFFLGFVLGMIVGVTFDRVWGYDYFHVKLGEILDTDFIYLKTGGLLQGYIISENENEIVFKMGESVINLSQSEVDHVDYNRYTRYARKSW